MVDRCCRHPLDADQDAGTAGHADHDASLRCSSGLDRVMFGWFWVLGAVGS